jgi:hypothetical protein
MTLVPEVALGRSLLLRLDLSASAAVLTVLPGRLSLADFASFLVSISADILAVIVNGILLAWAALAVNKVVKR